MQEQLKLLEERAKRARTIAMKEEGAAREDAEKELHELASQIAELRVPAAPRLLADDATPEAVGRLLAEHGGRLGVFSSEGGPLAILGGRYSQGPNLELFCKAYTGDSYTLDRVSRASICVDYPLLTIALTVQPSVLAGLASTPEMRGQGLLARFLYAVPHSLVGRREADPPSASEGTLADYDAAVGALLHLEATAADGGELVPRLISLEPQAWAALVALKEALEPMLGPGGDLHTLADWGNKLTGTVARVACALHVAQHVTDGNMSMPITRSTMLQAIAIGRYAIGHARAAFSVMGSDPATELAKRVLAWALATERVVVNKREVQRGLHLDRVAQLDAPFALLVERNYLRPLESVAPASPRFRRTGRPPSPTYAINPHAKRGQR